MLGPLEKMKILAFRDNEYTRPATIPVFPVLVNPESYDMNYAIEYNTDAPTGGDSNTPSFTRKSPEVLSFELVFDATGILDGLPRPTVEADLELFKRFLLGKESETHEPPHHMILWGQMLFKGRCTSANFKYKLFHGSGLPIRATVEVSFKGSISKLLSLAIDNLLSPDLTHLRTIRAGDTLPNLCDDIYEEPEHTIRVARANGLSGFRRLRPGTEITFPPHETAKS